jgi:ribosome-binding protein aMBF1 (putative translation factor)
MNLIDGHCIRHPFEESSAYCRQCGMEFCGECLVFAFGAAEPPFCVSCALAAAGVRSNAANAPSVSKRELRRRNKEQRKALKAERKARGEPEEPSVTVDFESFDVDALERNL